MRAPPARTKVPLPELSSTIARFGLSMICP